MIKLELKGSVIKVALLNCSECGNEVSENDNVCQNCGNPLNQNVLNMETTNIFNQQQTRLNNQELLLCDECGKEVNKEDDACQNCGNLLSTNENEKNEITENIKKIKEAANIICVLVKVVAVILFFVAFICIFQYGDGPGFALLFGIMGGILFVISNFIKAFIMWKAYMLETNYIISKNTEFERNGINKL